ncbi:MAG: hypothetical protein QM504_08155 [Pseudomonadota bacterium]
MSVTTESVCLFGFNIIPEEAERIRKKHCESNEGWEEVFYSGDLFDCVDGFLKLPNGFISVSYQGHDEPTGYLVGIQNEVLKRVVLNEANRPNMLELLRWAEENNIDFSEGYPENISKCYSY